MQIDFEKILVHANDKLSANGPAGSPSEWITLFKKFLRLETERLRRVHRFGASGGEVARCRAYIIDLLVCRACELAVSEESFGVDDSASPAAAGKSRAPFDEARDVAVVALGGYGRRELAPFSDVDLLFLYTGRKSLAAARKLAERVLYVLWDVGLTVGHSFRSVKECVEMARVDLHSRTAVAESRLITGSLDLFRRLNQQLESEIFSQKQTTAAFLESLEKEVELRYAKFGRTPCLQEPNLKEGAGGLRDLHAILWVGQARFGCRTLDDLRERDHLSGPEYAGARRAYEFLLRIRNESHFTTGRRSDSLTLDVQSDIALNLGYEPKRAAAASELLMRDYYRNTNELHQLCDSFLARTIGSGASGDSLSRRARRLVAEIENRQGSFYLTMKRMAKLPAASGLEVKDGRLSLGPDVGDLKNNPIRMIQAFAVAQAQGAALSDELKQEIRSGLPLVGKGFRASAEAGAAFVRLLGVPGRVSHGLRQMHETGFLARFLPEFSVITFLVQHDYYHRYTTDEHTLMAVEALDAIAPSASAASSRFSKVMAEVENPAVLYLGALLHDIGKGRGRGHVSRGIRISERICGRLGVDRDFSAKVTFLVKQHLAMSQLAERRNLAEDGLIDEFAETVGDLDRLNMLFLLTYADTSAVGPGVWNDWKGSLLWELYTKTRARLTGSRPWKLDGSRSDALKQKVILELLPRYLPSEVERHFAMMPERYSRSADAARLARHFEFAERLGDRPLLVDWQTAPDQQCTELTVFTRDREGLFSRIAGTLTALGVNILSADLYTRDDGLVIDSFKVCAMGSHHPLREENWALVERTLNSALDGGYDVAATVESWRARHLVRAQRTRRPRIQTKIGFDQNASPSSTVIEVRAEDEPGVAYCIANALASLHLNIAFAKIATEKSHALDIFYVTDQQGHKVAPAFFPELEKAVLEALSQISLASIQARGLMKEAV